LYGDPPGTFSCLSNGLDRLDPEEFDRFGISLADFFAPFRQRSRRERGSVCPMKEVMTAARTVGCRGVMVRTGWHVAPENEARCDCIADNLPVAAHWITALTNQV
jgi:hypothetical protein